jgi:hypothetical protein
MNDQVSNPSPGPGHDQAQWPGQVVDLVDGVVTAAHDRVVRPLLLIARGIVFGIIVATTALILSVLLSIAIVRLLDVYVFGDRVWASDALVGALFAAVGVVAWTKRRTRQGSGET